MDHINTTTVMGSSLLGRDVYSVCFPERDNLDSLRGELAAARKKFFTNGKKTVRVGKSEIIKGFDGKLKGKLYRHGLYWKKTAGRVVLEEAFEQRNGYSVVYRDFRGIIASRVFFDKNQLWLKSEYYEPWDSTNAQIIFKPKDAFNVIERFDRDTEQKRYRATELHPLPYLPGTAEQSIINAKYGEPMLIVSTADGDFCYCPKKEAQARKVALDEIKDGTIMLMPAWEIKDGALTTEPGEEETTVTFTSLEEYAKVEPGQDTGEAAPLPSPPDSSDTEEFRDVPVLEEQPAAEAVISREKQILQAARKAAGLESAGEIAAVVADGEVQTVGTAAKTERYEVQNGQVVVPEKSPGEALAAETKTVGETAVYRGEYQDGKRDGFGSHFYKNGSLCYAGFWKNDKRDGLGVSFRESDHALHIAKWENGQPGGFVSLFDKDGNLRYGGHMVNGKKQGAGVSFRQADGTIFVGKWENGEPAGLGSSFDENGNLLYYGGWKDGKRNGHGTEFDLNGAIVFDGEWKDDKYHNGILYQKQKDMEPADPFAESLTDGD